MPIHPYGQVKKKGSLGSPYAVRDYYAIDSPWAPKTICIAWSRKLTKGR
jgi:hypothetical protein